MRACEASREASACRKLEGQQAAWCSGAREASWGSCLSTRRRVEARFWEWMWWARKRPM